MKSEFPTLPLPAGITIDIRQPSPDVPTQYAKFVGKWGGYWGGAVASNLYVESVSPLGEAQGVYAWGTSKLVTSPGAIKFRARIESDVLSWGDAVRGIGFEFRLAPDGKLKGERFILGTQQNEVAMSKME